MSGYINLVPPAVGEVWAGQGGIYGGIIPSRNGNPAYHIVFAVNIASVTWGELDKLSPLTTAVDGAANTAALLEDSSEYPAAKAASEYQADGHQDFYLPSIAELNEAWINLGDMPWGWVWSSTQRDEDFAFTMYFDGACQGANGKGNEFFVCAARKVAILPGEAQ